MSNAFHLIVCFNIYIYIYIYKIYTVKLNISAI